MKLNKASRYGSLIFLMILALVAAEDSWSYQFGGTQIGFRSYDEGDRTLNKLFFEIKDDQGQYVTDEMVVSSIKLYNPNSVEVNLSSLSYDLKVELFYGSYNDYYGQWNYGDPYYVNSYGAEILDDLISGTYRLEVTMTDSQLLQKEIVFNQKVSLPPISADSFDIYPDSSGNVFWT